MAFATRPFPGPEETSLAAQITSSGLHGTITDEHGRALPNVTVEIDVPGSASRSAVTDRNGRFRFLGLPAGRLVLEAAYEGHRSITKAIYLSPARSTEVELAITTGRQTPPPPPPSTSPRLSVEPAMPPLFWNVRTEHAPGYPYRVVVDLAALEHPSAVVTEPVSADLEVLEAQWLKATSVASIEILLLYDSRYLRLEGDTSERRSFAVEADKLRKLHSGRISAPDPEAEYRGEALSTWLLGREIFHMRATGLSGTTTVTFSFWAYDQPVGEVSLPVCFEGETPVDCVEAGTGAEP